MIPAEKFYKRNGSNGLRRFPDRYLYNIWYVVDEGKSAIHNHLSKRERSTPTTFSLLQKRTRH